jgi:hypothetical protein
MPDTPYNKREIDLLLKGVKQHMEDTIRPIYEKTDRILEQTIRTNGRVSNLEKWRSYITGAVAVLTVLVLPIIFMFLKSHLWYN